MRVYLQAFVGDKPCSCPACQMDCDGTVTWPLEKWLRDRMRGHEKGMYDHPQAEDGHWMMVIEL